jgi:hypothetical protein
MKWWKEDKEGLLLLLCTAKNRFYLQKEQNMKWWKEEQGGAVVVIFLYLQNEQNQKRWKEDKEGLLLLLCTAKNRFYIADRAKHETLERGQGGLRGCCYYCGKLRTGFTLQKEQNQKRWKEDKEGLLLLLCTAKNRFFICRKSNTWNNGKRTRRGCCYYSVQLRTGFILQIEQNMKRWK